MAKSFKYKDNMFLDSTGIVHNKQLLSDILVVDMFDDTSGSDWKEMLRNKIAYCKPKFTRQNQSILLNGGWLNHNFGFAICTRIGTQYQIVWLCISGICYCRYDGSQYYYWSNFDTISTDANGWKKKEYADRTEYWKNGSYPNTTYNGNGWGYLPDIQLPVGLTFNDNTMTFSAEINCGDSAMTASCRINSGGTYIYGGWQNKYGGTVTAGFRYHFAITVYK